jgi:hypothetical protein
MKLDFTGKSQAEIREFQETIVSTISKIKHGLFNYEASLGLQDSIKILSDLHLQSSTYLREMREKLDEIPVTTEMIEDDEA